MASPCSYTWSLRQTPALHPEQVEQAASGNLRAGRKATCFEPKADLLNLTLGRSIIQSCRRLACSDFFGAPNKMRSHLESLGLIAGERTQSRQLVESGFAKSALAGGVYSPLLFGGIRGTAGSQR